MRIAEAIALLIAFLTYMEARKRNETFEETI